MEFSVSQKLFQVFDPEKALEAGDSALYVPRAESVVDEFLSEIRFPGGHRFVLVGAIGSGKSTEMARLHQKMARDAGRVTILLDLFKQFRVDELAAGQVVFLVALTVLRAANLDDETEKTLIGQLQKTYMGIVDRADRRDLNVGKLLKGLAVVVGGIAAGPAGAAAAMGAAAATEALDLRLALPGRGRDLQANDPMAIELHHALQDVLVRARKSVDGKRFLVLIDGLDKIGAEPQIRDLFCTGVLSAANVEGIDLVYAAPPSLIFQAGFGVGTGFRALRLDLFNIFMRTGGLNPQEIEAMRTLLDRRVHEAGLRNDDVWPDGDIEHSAVDRIIIASGGLTRDLIHIVRRAVVVASRAEEDKCLRVEDLEAGIAKRAEEYLLKLNLDIDELLRDTWRTRRRPGGALVPALLNDNLILYYDNGQPWCHPHPMVMPTLRERFPDDIGDEDNASQRDV